MTPKEIEALHARVRRSHRIDRAWELAGFASFILFALLIIFI